MYLIPETYFTVQEQTRLFLMACLLGFPFSLVFDGFRILRLLLPHHFLGVFLEDVLFFLLCGTALAAFTAVECRGEFRMFYPLGALLGFTICRLTLGNALVGIVRRCAAQIQSALARLLQPIRRKLSRFPQKIKLIFVKITKIRKIEKKMSKDS